MTPPPALLGQSAVSLVAPALGAMLLIGGGIYALWMLRRSMVGAEDAQPTRQPFTLQHLREMRAAGEITEAEFERTRAMVIHAVRESAVAREAADGTGSRPGRDLTGAPLPSAAGKQRTPGNRSPSDAGG